MHRYIDAILNGCMTLKEWYVKRSVRLLPMVAISAVVFEIFLHIHNLVCPGGFCKSGQEIDFFGTIITAVGIQSIGVFDNPMVNNPTWYVSVLLLTYILFFISTKIAKNMQCSPYYLYTFIILLSCGIQKYDIEIPFLTASTTRGYSCFFFGLLLARYVKKYGVSSQIAIIDVIMLSVLLYLFFVKSELISKNLKYLLSFVFYPGLILLTETKMAKIIFHNKFWGTWGQISFNAYIWHGPMFRAMYAFAHILTITPHFAQRKWMYLFCLLTQLVGMISFYCIEKPVNRFIMRKLYNAREE